MRSRTACREHKGCDQGARHHEGLEHGPMVGRLARSSCVFTTPVGTPIDPRIDYREFKKLLARAGLPSVRPHDLRHTAASLLLAQGVPARVVMEILGHSAIALTMNTYQGSDRLSPAIAAGALQPESLRT
jgi:integrase